MIDYARPYESTMCDFYNQPPSPNPQPPLENFQIFKKTNQPYIYSQFYNSYDPYEPESNAPAVYHDLVAPREYHNKDEYKYKLVRDWTEEDTVSWIIDTIQCSEFSEADIPFYSFNISGEKLLMLTLEGMYQKMVHPNVAPHRSKCITEFLFGKLQHRLYQERPPQSEHNDIMDLDTIKLEQRNRYPSEYKPHDASYYTTGESSDENDTGRYSETGSPGSYSDSKSEYEDKKPLKRPPGRPKGSGRKVGKRPKSVSVPEFLRDLLMNPRHCPEKIKWEKYSESTFRFVKPDMVAKLWGELKQNENMTFEKFSRAMRYHYRGEVLVSVPSARLVYKFGPKGPDIKTDNPNFEKFIKSEIDTKFMSYA